MTMSCQSTPVKLASLLNDSQRIIPMSSRLLKTSGVEVPDCKLEDKEGASGSSTKESGGHEKTEGRTGSSTAQWYHKESH